MKGQLNIETLYAFIMRDKDGSEGIIGKLLPNGMWMPLVGADLDRVSSLEPIAQETADATKECVILAHFSKREDIKVITPNKQSTSKAVPLDPEGKIVGLT